jgi:pyruvate kinase
MLAAGDSFVLDVQSHVASTGQRASVNSSAFVAQCQPGDELVLGKGVHATVTDADHCQVVCRVTSGGSVYTCCGVANKSRYDPTEDLVEYDRRVLDSLGDGIDYVCPSFTDSRAKVLQVRNATDGPLQRKVMAKIESPMGVSQIVDIANHADGIMLCRGDLGSYYTHQEVHRLASIFAETSRVSGIELALATDFFESMDRSGMLSAEDQDELNFALSLCPNWIILNETSSSDAWRLIAETAASFMTQRQR